MNRHKIKPALFLEGQYTDVAVSIPLSDKCRVELKQIVPSIWFDDLILGRGMEIAFSIEGGPLDGHTLSVFIGPRPKVETGKEVPFKPPYINR